VEDSFKLLEGRIRRAAERLKELQSEADGLRVDVKEARARARAAEEQLAAAGTSDGRSEEAEALAGELKTLRREQEEIRDRIERLVELLDNVE
jgi:predicted  nucleic acid-binding Zn-ribbon protein